MPIHVFRLHLVGARSRAASDDKLTVPVETVLVIGCGVSNDSSDPSMPTVGGSALARAVGMSICAAKAGAGGSIGEAATVCANANFLLSAFKGGGVVGAGGDTCGDGGITAGNPRDVVVTLTEEWGNFPAGAAAVCAVRGENGRAGGKGTRGDAVGASPTSVRRCFPAALAGAPAA
jgi:hypothetical protein